METLAQPRTLRQRREALGIAQEHLARLAGVSHSMVCMLDRGYNPNRSDVRDRIVAVLDRLEAERAALGAGWELTPDVGRSGFRDDRDRPEAAA